jgi:tetratricopeptide (TPR) repeat protein
MTRVLLRAFVSARLHLVACSLIAAVAACTSSTRRDLLPAPLPDVSRVDPGVQAQVRGRYETLSRALADKVDAAELASAFGQYGMVLQAAEYFDVAEPCYLNAETLAPDEMRWPYDLAGLYRSRGETDKAEAAFKRVLTLRPDDLPTLIGLGRLHLDQGRPEAAEPLFLKAYGFAPRTVAVLAGLGRVAVAKHDYPQAVKYLEDALAIDPEAESLHAPLATAYRGLGQPDKAQPHLRQWRNRDIYVPDPLQQDLDLLLESALSYELRGVREFEVRDWKAAAAFFRKGIALAHDNTALSRSLHHKLGTALYLSGDLPGAQEQFEDVVRHAPSSAVDEASAKAHYSLGVLMASKAQPKPAVEHLLAAVRYQPNYVEAHLALGDVLRRSGRGDASLEHYHDALAINPRQMVARLGYAMALVQLRRDRDARDWLDESVRLYADRTDLKIALARLLAASPDDRVRDGRRALAIAQQLFDSGEKSTSLGETIAMALAEQGSYAQAISIQRDVMAAAQKAGLTAATQRMAANLALYEQRQPCRSPWIDDDLVSVPTAPVTAASPTVQPH